MVRVTYQLERFFFASSQHILIGVIHQISLL